MAAASTAIRFESQKLAALFRRFASHLRAASVIAAQQLGHREREVVYQKAVAVELSRFYTCELEHPVPIRYTSSFGQVSTLTHERADIVAKPQRGAGPGPYVVVEIKRGAGGNAYLFEEASDQARRYAAHLQQDMPIHGVCVVLFDKTGKRPPAVMSECWIPTVK